MDRGVELKTDFDLIVYKLDRDLPHINLYPLGDTHIGSKEFNLDAFNRWKKAVMADEFGRVVIVGDIMDMATKTSLTNLYESTMTPMQQKLWVTEQFMDFKDKIIAAIPGNHEYRGNKLTGMCPLYDVLAKLNLEYLYRANMAFLKINLGSRNAERQCSYTVVLAHGKVKRRTMDYFPYAIDGMDIFINGHFHDPGDNFKSKIVIDSKNESISMRNFIRLTVPSFTTYGGYGMRGMYMPSDGEKFPIIRLDGSKKNTELHWV